MAVMAVMAVMPVMGVSHGSHRCESWQSYARTRAPKHRPLGAQQRGHTQPRTSSCILLPCILSSPRKPGLRMWAAATGGRGARGTFRGTYYTFAAKPHVGR